MDLRMAVYAAMIDRVDQNIGKLMAELKQMSIAENTVVMFLSDNGGCHEGGMLGRGVIDPPEKRNQSTADSIGEAWANAINTPFRKYKTFTYEGGAATPFLLSWPKRIKPSLAWYGSPAHIIDVMPTVLELAGAEYPAEYNGHKIKPLHGISLAPACDGKPLERGGPLFSEHIGNAFVIEGDWKLVGTKVATYNGPDLKKWELYNLADDRTELNDLAGKYPERVQRMSSAWKKWADEANVYPRPKGKSKQAQKEMH